MTTRHWLLLAAAFTALTAVACVCSYSLTRTGDAFSWPVSTGLVVLGVGYTGFLEQFEGAASWSGRTYGLAFMALMAPVILIDSHAGQIVGASVIGSHAAVRAAHLAATVRGYLRRR